MYLSKVVHHLSRDRAIVCNAPCSGPCYRLLAPAGTICSGEAAAGPSQQIYLDIYTDIYTAASNFINISKYFLSRFSLVSVSCLFISSFIYSFLQHTSSLAAKWEEVTVCQLPAANLSWQLLCWWSCPNSLIANEIIHLCILDNHISNLVLTLIFINLQIVQICIVHYIISVLGGDYSGLPRLCGWNKHNCDQDASDVPSVPVLPSSNQSEIRGNVCLSDSNLHNLLLHSAG